MTPAERVTGQGAAAHLVALAYLPGPAGKRAALARAARAGAGWAARSRLSRVRHAPPYPVPAPLWRRTVEVPNA